MLSKYFGTEKLQLFNLTERCDSMFLTYLPDNASGAALINQAKERYVNNVNRSQLMSWCPSVWAVCSSDEYLLISRTQKLVLDAQTKNSSTLCWCLQIRLEMSK